MAKIEWNDKAFIAECVNVGMDRLVQGAKAIRDDARRILKSKLRGDVNRPVYRKGPYAGQIYTERRAGEMVDTIRVFRKQDSSAREVRIYMGNYKVWWATQMEYGRGGWRGGARPCLRPALRNTGNTFKPVFESGAGQTKLEPGWEVVE